MFDGRRNASFGLQAGGIILPLIVIALSLLFDAAKRSAAISLTVIASVARQALLPSLRAQRGNLSYRHCERSVAISATVIASVAWQSYKK